MFRYKEVVKSGGKLDCEYSVSLGHFHNVGTLTMSPQLIAEKRQDRHHIVLETRADVRRKVVEKPLVNHLIDQLVSVGIVQTSNDFKNTLEALARMED